MDVAVAVGFPIKDRRANERPLDEGFVNAYSAGSLNRIDS